MEFQGFLDNRTVKKVQRNYDLVVVGGGLTGVCCAITAARSGIKVGLIQDRPVLGGNASSEVRLWALGATSHMGNNNRWAREGGVINEILVENTYRNKEGNPVLFDMVLMDKVLSEPNITLYLNTIVYDIKKSSPNRISEILAYNPSVETKYEIKGEIFADCSGDGIVSYLSGASYRMGAEDKEVYNEGFSPDKEVYGELLGHTIFFYMKDTGSPVEYVTPDFAIKNVEQCISKIYNPEYFNINHHGCKYWWIEYGGRLDTIHDTEKIKYELWKVVYGIWGYIKNSGKFPEMKNYTLEWVGLIPGKRESRRFKGLYTLTQQDIIEQHEHYDAVAYGGWSIDLHPSDGVYASGRACNQWHSKGIYQIPFRCYVTADVENLMFGGRIISVSHVANGSTRVMCTSAHGGQAIGMAAALCVKEHRNPIDYTDVELIKTLQTKLIAIGQHIPWLKIEDKNNLINIAHIEVSSTFNLKKLDFNGNYITLKESMAQLFPIRGKLPTVSLKVCADEETRLQIQLRKSIKEGNYTPEVILENIEISLKKGEQKIKLDFSTEFNDETYVFLCFMKNPLVKLAESNTVLTGILTVFNQVNIAVSNYGKQMPPEGIGVESFEFWCPKRRPEGKNLALEFYSPIYLYGIEQLKTSYYRPFLGTNAWVADFNDKTPTVILKWNTPQKINKINLFFDVDYDHPMETVQYGHYDNIMPYCVRRFRIYDKYNNLLFQNDNNHQGICSVILKRVCITDYLRIEFISDEDNLISLLGIYCC